MLKYLPLCSSLVLHHYISSFLIKIPTRKKGEENEGWGRGGAGAAPCSVCFSPLFGSDHLGPNLDSLIREHQQDPTFLNSPFVCSLITSAEHEA